MTATILVADDDRYVRRLLRQRLEESGYKVVEATNGKKALRQFRKSEPHAVITDIVMPDMDGHELIAKLLAECPAVRIVAISGAIEQDVPKLLEQAAQSGALRTLSKPFTSEQLFAAVREVLEAPVA